MLKSTRDWLRTVEVRLDSVFHALDAIAERAKDLDKQLAEIEKKLTVKPFSLYAVSSDGGTTYHVGECLKRIIERVDALETTLSELTGSAPGMWSQVNSLRQDLNQLIAAAGCRKREVPEVQATPAIPAHTVIEKLPKGSRE